MSYYVKESGPREVSAMRLWNVNNRSCIEKETIATVSSTREMGGRWGASVGWYKVMQNK